MCKHLFLLINIKWWAQNAFIVEVNSPWLPMCYSNHKLLIIEDELIFEDWVKSRVLLSRDCWSEPLKDIVKILSSRLGFKDQFVQINLVVFSLKSHKDTGLISILRFSDTFINEEPMDFMTIRYYSWYLRIVWSDNSHTIIVIKFRLFNLEDLDLVCISYIQKLIVIPYKFVGFVSISEILDSDCSGSICWIFTALI